MQMRSISAMLAAVSLTMSSGKVDVILAPTNATCFLHFNLMDAHVYLCHV